jgi:hypothetical protein
MTEVQLDIDTLKREGTEVARYRVSSGRRALIGRYGRGAAELIDVPLASAGSAYHVDRGWHDARVMEAFVRDYLEQAEALDRCPMSAAAIGFVVDSTESDEVTDLLAAMWKR